MEKPLPIWFDKVDGFIRVYDETRHLVLFGPQKYGAIYNSIRYLISQKSGITYVFPHNDHGAEISVIWLVERSVSKLLILICY